MAEPYHILVQLQSLLGTGYGAEVASGMIRKPKFRAQGGEGWETEISFSNGALPSNFSLVGRAQRWPAQTGSKLNQNGSRWCWAVFRTIGYLDSAVSAPLGRSLNSAFTKAGLRSTHRMNRCDPGCASPSDNGASPRRHSALLVPLLESAPHRDVANDGTRQ